MTRQITLYGRPGCHLCDEARTTIARLAGEHDLAVQEVDIDGDDALLRAYLERIPVVELDGREISELELDADELRAALHTVRP